MSIVLGVVLVLVARDPEAGGVLPIGIQYQIETGAARLGSDVPNIVIIGVAVVIAAAVWWRRRSRTAAPDQDTDNLTPSPTSTAQKGSTS